MSSVTAPASYSCLNILRILLSYCTKLLSNNIDVRVLRRKYFKFFYQRRKQFLFLFTIRDYFTNSQLSDASNVNIIQKWPMRVEYL